MNFFAAYKFWHVVVSNAQVYNSIYLPVHTLKLKVIYEKWLESIFKSLTKMIVF